jgi:hypothetical protein
MWQPDCRRSTPTARDRFYAEKLGLEPVDQRPGGLLYRCAEPSSRCSLGRRIFGNVTQMAFEVEHLDDVAFAGNQPANARSSSSKHPCRPSSWVSRRSSVELSLLTITTVVEPSDSEKESSISWSTPRRFRS